MSIVTGLNGGTSIDVTAEATIKNIVGILDYAFRSYTILTDGSFNTEISGLKKLVPASAAKSGEITVASFNLENFFDDKNNSKLEGKESKVSEEHFEKRSEEDIACDSGSAFAAGCVGSN